MIPGVSLPRDIRRFYYEARHVGIRSAVGKGINKLTSGFAARSARQFPAGSGGVPVPGLGLPIRSVLQVPLVVIVSDTQIEQCVLYRISQKRELLRRAGYRCVVLTSGQRGLIRSYLPLARLVIIYRTAVDPTALAEWRLTKVPVAFEFDDLVVGREQVQASGILPSLTPQQRSNLCNEAARLRDAAMACDFWIVSTEQLREHYASVFPSERIWVLPNYLPLVPSRRATRKTTTFAYTSPSQCIDGEVTLLNDLLAAYSRTVIEPFEIAVIGNAKVAARVEKARHPLCTVRSIGFCSYAEYIDALAASRYVLIPLTDKAFNHCKTVVRALDAARAGVLPLFSPVGQYGVFRTDPLLRTLAFEDGEWAADAQRVPRLSEAYEPLLRAFVGYCEAHFGEAAALSRYQELMHEVPEH